jgi:hypothetical protein
MACYLEVVDLGVWRVTRDRMKPLKNPKKNPLWVFKKEIRLNARAKNCLFESLSMEIFNQVFTLKSANKFSQNCMSSMKEQTMSMNKNIS